MEVCYAKSNQQNTCKFVSFDTCFFLSFRVRNLWVRSIGNITRWSKRTNKNANVEFDSRFGNGAYVQEASINSQEEKLVFETKVKNTGYIKDAQITLEGANFEITGNSEIKRN